MTRLGTNRYGKAEVRVVRVGRGLGPGRRRRRPRPERVVGAVRRPRGDPPHRRQRATSSPPTPRRTPTTRSPSGSARSSRRRYALALARHFVTSQEPITRARVAVERVPVDARSARPATRSRAAANTCARPSSTTRRPAPASCPGVRDLIVLNTTDSEFWGFPRDEYTTLPETRDRMLATQVSATWRYREHRRVDWAAAFAAAHGHAARRRSPTPTATRCSRRCTPSAAAIVDAVPEICEVRLALPNKHHFARRPDAVRRCTTTTRSTTPPTGPTGSSRARCSPTTPATTTSPG